MYFSARLNTFILSALVVTGGMSISFAEESVDSGDLYFTEDSLRTGPVNPVVNQKTRLYISVSNTTAEDMKGVVRAFDLTDNLRIDTEQTFTTIETGDADLFWDFEPKSAGVHEIAFRIIPWEAYPNNVIENDKVIKKIFVDYDVDGDGMGDQVDPDDDNDGVNDTDDVFPLDGKEWEDKDMDGVGDNSDTDDDNDGIPDDKDVFPNNPAEGSDTDGDGEGDNTDEDDDGDGIRDASEILNGTDPLKLDTDNDGIDDGADDYPLDDRYQKDTDRDGEPNKEDRDDDGDGVNDGEDAFPEDAKEWQDLDGDGVGDIADEDDDNDGLEDIKEQEKGSNPRIADTDGDGVSDGEDALPLDATESKDSDGDGLGDNKDENDENKGPVILLSEAGPFSVGRNEIFQISAEGSSDPEGGELQYLWEIVDSSGEVLKTQDSAILTLKSPSIGDLILRLTVTDISDESRTKNLPLHVGWSQWDKYSMIFGILFLIGLFLLLGLLWRKKRNENNRS